MVIGPLAIASVAQAQPPDVTGQRYNQAARELRQAGFSPEVGTMVGTDLADGQCWVVNAAKITRMDWKGRQDNTPVRLDLNCYADPSSHLDPGFSAGNSKPEAVAVRSDHERKLNRQERLARAAARGNEDAADVLRQVQQREGVMASPDDFEQPAAR